MVFRATPLLVAMLACSTTPETQAPFPCGTDASDACGFDAFAVSARDGASEAGSVAPADGPSLDASPDSAQDGASESASVALADGSPFDASAISTQDGAPDGSVDSPADGSLIPDAFVLASLGASRDSNNNNLCNFNARRNVLAIGVAVGGSPVREADGTFQMGSAVVNVSCSVTGGFDVNLNASLGGVQGGSLTIVGHVDASSGGQAIHAVVNTPNSGGTFTQDTCTIAFTYAGAPVPIMPAVATGAIWAHLSCPMMLNASGVFVTLMGGTTVQETCDGEVDFAFDNCG